MRFVVNKGYIICKFCIFSGKFYFSRVDFNIIHYLKNDDFDSFLNCIIFYDVYYFEPKRGYNVTPYSLALNDTAKYSPVIYSGLDSMLTKNALNTSDITNVIKFLMFIF